MPHIPGHPPEVQFTDQQLALIAALQAQAEEDDLERRRNLGFYIDKDGRRIVGDDPAIGGPPTFTSIPNVTAGSNLGVPPRNLAPPGSGTYNPMVDFSVMLGEEESFPMVTTPQSAGQDVPGMAPSPTAPSSVEDIPKQFLAAGAYDPLAEFDSDLLPGLTTSAASQIDKSIVTQADADKFTGFTGGDEFEGEPEAGAMPVSQPTWAEQNRITQQRNALQRIADDEFDYEENIGGRPIGSAPLLRRWQDYERPEAPGIHQLGVSTATGQTPPPASNGNGKEDDLKETEDMKKDENGKKTSDGKKTSGGETAQPVTSAQTFQQFLDSKFNAAVKRYDRNGNLKTDPRTFGFMPNMSDILADWVALDPENNQITDAMKTIYNKQRLQFMRDTGMVVDQDQTGGSEGGAQSAASQTVGGFPGIPGDITAQAANAQPVGGMQFPGSTAIGGMNLPGSGVGASGIDLWGRSISPFEAYQQYRLGQIPGATPGGLLSIDPTGKIAGTGYQPAFGRYLLGSTLLPAEQLEAQTQGEAFRNYLEGGRRSLQDVRGLYSGLGGYLNTLAGGQIPTGSGYGLIYDPASEGFKSDIINSSLAAVGVPPGMGARMQSSMSRMYDLMQTLYGPQGASNFVNWVGESFGAQPGAMAGFGARQFAPSSQVTSPVSIAPPPANMQEMLAPANIPVEEQEVLNQMIGVPGASLNQPQISQDAIDAARKAATAAAAQAAPVSGIHSIDPDKWALANEARTPMELWMEGRTGAALASARNIGTGGLPPGATQAGAFSYLTPEDQFQLSPYQRGVSTGKFAPMAYMGAVPGQESIFTGNTGLPTLRPSAAFEEAMQKDRPIDAHLAQRVTTPAGAGGYFDPAGTMEPGRVLDPNKFGAEYFGGQTMADVLSVEADTGGSRPSWGFGGLDTGLSKKDFTDWLNKNMNVNWDRFRN